MASNRRRQLATVTASFATMNASTCDLFSVILFAITYFQNMFRIIKTHYVNADFQKSASAIS